MHTPEEHEMVPTLDARDILCPYCGETHELLVEPPAQPVRYTEDCSVCCRPIEVLLTPLPEGGFELSVQTEND